jgi:fumarylacetoacetate (FAA) hydrolase
MIIVRYFHKKKIKAGLLINDIQVINIDDIKLNTNIKLNEHDKYVISNKLYNIEPIFLMSLINKEAINEKLIFNKEKLIQLDEVELLSPITKPNSLRDAYAFKQHVEAGRKARGLPMIKEFDLNPVYYYSNHSAITGPGTLSLNKKHLNNLDFELELAIIIGKEGENISIENADQYIFGFMIMNDWSARDIQKNEMKLNLGPAKGKDFCTSIGPYLVTKNELKNHTIKSKYGNVYDLKMSAFINDNKISEDTSKNMYWTFAQIISHISIGTKLYPGDVIGSGTCATGCLYELNLTNKTNTWLQLNDTIKLEIEKLGALENTIGEE